MVESNTVFADSKAVHIPFGDFSRNLGAGVALLIIAAGAVALPFAVPDSVPGLWLFVAVICWGIAALIVFSLVFLPISLAMDVGDRVPEIKQAREKDKSLKSVRISHPYLWAIVILNLVGFWFVIGWIVAIAWACSPGHVVIPDKIFDKAFQKTKKQGDGVVLEQTDAQPSRVVSLEHELTEIKLLEEKGLLSKMEADARRNLVLSR